MKTTYDRLPWKWHISVRSWLWLDVYQSKTAIDLTALVGLSIPSFRFNWSIVLGIPNTPSVSWYLGVVAAEACRWSSYFSSEDRGRRGLKLCENANLFGASGGASYQDFYGYHPKSSRDTEPDYRNYIKWSQIFIALGFEDGPRNSGLNQNVKLGEVLDFWAVLELQSGSWAKFGVRSAKMEVP